MIAVLIESQWLVLAVSLLMFLGAFSVKLNAAYQFHALLFKKQTSKSVQKDPGELSFVSGMTALLLFVGFLFLYFGKFVDLAWIWLLIIDLLIFLAYFVGFCVATLMYVFFKKIFKR